jgi:hypothetical protein
VLAFWGRGLYFYKNIWFVIKFCHYVNTEIGMTEQHQGGLA